ncbi:MAG: hypothetical protein AB1798_09045 [Spirochaetota bacterium]
MRSIIHRVSKDLDDSFFGRRRINRWDLPAHDELAQYFSKDRKDLESKIFRLAYKMKGRITLSDIVIETGLGMKEAEAYIEKMVDGIRVRMEVSDQGIVYYEFPEIIARFEEGKDLFS